ncbi:glycerophosphodiester phosphodiesterase [Streptomyces sp. NPDC056638]|uniref:glycerophosphodiester phosphodiesterase n=1 Tax=Streptomyces sp. NPDC056638 TaxID=3345887 RepID=UPI0036C9AC0E
MPMPSGIATVALTGRYIRPDGTPLKGSVTIAAPSLLTLPGADTISAGSATVTLDSAGAFTLTLIATDNPGMQPTSWTYQVTEKFQDIASRTYAIQLPSTLPTVSIADIAPADPSTGQYILVPGPEGPAGKSILTGAGTPSPLLGANGDVYIDTTPGAVKMYGPKASGTWPSTGISLGGGGGLISSINGKTGTVVLSPADIGAEVAGAAATAKTEAVNAATAAIATAKTEAVASAATAAQATYLPRAIVPVTQLTAMSLFYIAHRGSGGEFPEHTLEAYESAVAAGARAIEVSVRLTADGVPVCIHDEALTRTTYATGDVSTWNYQALRHKVLTNGRQLLGQGRVDVPIPTLREVLDRFLGKVVIFLEPKSNPSVPVVQQLLTDFYPQAKDSVVWKNYYLATSFPWAKQNGFKTWAYVDAATTDAQMDALDQSLVDYWGVPTGMADARVQAVVARGKPVIAWEVHRRSERDRLASLGVKGMMCSELIYVRRTGPSRTSDDFATQIKAPGDLGTVNYDAMYALKFDDVGGSAYINSMSNRSVLLGSISNPTPPATYTIRFDMMYEGVPAATEHAGIAFGKASDDIYRFSQVNATGGYHIAIRGNGDMQMYTHAAGVTSGTQIAATSAAVTAPTVGGWMSFTVDVTPTTVTLTRTDLGTPVVISATNSTFRGGYVHLSTGSITSTSTKPHWRNVSITTP